MSLKFNYSRQGISLSNQHVVDGQRASSDTRNIGFCFRLHLYVMTEMMHDLSDQLPSWLDEGGINIFIRLMRLLYRTWS